MGYSFLRRRFYRPTALPSTVMAKRYPKRSLGLVPLATSTGSATAGGATSVSMQVPVSAFTALYMAVPDSIAKDWVITGVNGPAGQNLLLGGQPVSAEFFSSKNPRFGLIAPSFVPGALSIGVNAQNVSGEEREFSAAFYGVPS